MKQVSTLIITILFFWITSAQDYQVIRSDRTVFYDFHIYPYSLNTIRIDSIQVINQDSIFYPIPTIYQVEENCYEPFGPSLMGSKIMVKANGDNLIFNKYNDTIKICTKAKLGDSWPIILPNNEVSIKATVVDHKVENFLELTDSVKTIQFQPVNEADTGKLLVFGSSIKLSKNYGIIEVIDFKEFPNKSWNNSFEYKALQLLGLTHPSKGVQNLTWFEVYDFQIGDQFHGINCTECLDKHSCTEYIQTIEKREDFYSDKGLLEKIVYTINNEHSRYNYADRSTQYGIDTLKKTIQLQNQNFDILPVYTYQHAYGNDYGIEYTQNRMLFYKNTVAKVIPVNHYDHICFTDSCWTKGYCLIDGYEPFYYYAKGLGGPYYTDDTDFFGCIYTRDLVYYKKGNESWGTPLNITSVENISIDKQLAKIYPNPAQHNFTITTNQKYLPTRLRIIDLSGKTVLDEDVNSISKIIQINDLKEGLYLVAIYNEDYVFPAQKVLVSK